MAVTLTTRAGKGSPLTNTEIDQNWDDVQSLVNTNEIGLANLQGGILTSTDSITAGATQTQAGATALTTAVNRASVVANTNNGLKLSTPAAGKRIYIKNNGANAAQIWPGTGHAIDGGATNAVDPNALAAGESRWYIAFNVTIWRTE